MAGALTLAVGVYLLALSGDDALTGLTTAEFLLYTKVYRGDKLAETEHGNDSAHVTNSLSLQASSSAGIDSYFKSPAPACPRDALWRPAELLGDNNDEPVARLVNGDRYTKYESCPKGAEVPTFKCSRVMGTLSYKATLRDFPFHSQDFAVLVEEDVMENSGQQAGAHFGRRTVENMCVLNSLTGLSSNVANGVQFASLTWGTRASAKCYPPLTGCVTGNETACEAAGDGNKEEKDECLLSDGSVITPRRRVSLYAIGRNSVAKALLRYFLVPAAVASLILCTFVMHPIDDLSSRYSANSGLLISTVLFHLSITSTAFRSSRFTRFDRVMISVYGLLWLTLAFNATLYFLNRRSWMKINRRKYRSYARTLNIVIGVYLALSTFVSWFAVAFVSPTSDLASPYLTLFFYALLPVVGTVAHFTYLRRMLPLVGPRHAQPSERYHDMEYGVEMQGPSSGFPSDRDLAAEHSALLLPGGYQQRSVPSAASERHSRSHLMLGSSDGISNRDED